MTKLYGGMEGGGTKFVCVIASDPQNIVDEIRFPTTTPEETLARAMAFFQKYQGRLAGIGLAPFGPLDVNEDSPTYGRVCPTPKPGWSRADILGPFKKFGLPLTFDLDVNAAAFGEWYWVDGNRRCDPLVYYTIGTGIGAGILINNRLVHGMLHPEAGHMRLPRPASDAAFEGTCPFHKDCFEGLACGPAMRARWGQSAESLPADHPAWELEAEYIALAMTNTLLMLSPQRVVLGGGVMEHPGMLARVRKRTYELLNDYVQPIRRPEQIDEILVPPALGGRSGILGAVAMVKVQAEYGRAKSAS